MGFFKDFKNDMKQAVNELLTPEGETSQEELFSDEDMVDTLGDFSAEELPKVEETVENTKEEALEELEDEDIEELSPEELEELLEEFDGEEEVVVPQDTGEDMDSLASLLSGEITIGDLEQLGSTEEIKEEPNEMEMPEAPEEMKEEEEFLEESTLETDSDSEAEQEMLREEEYSTPEEASNAEASMEDVDVEEALEEPVKEEQEMVEEMKQETQVVDNTTETAYGYEESEASDSTAYITKGTRIVGNLMTDGSIDILGSVQGDVNCYGKLVVSGTIEGKVEASEIYANAAKISGDIISAGSVKIGVGSVIVGNIEANSAVIAGAVNGDLDVKGPVIVDSTAVIMGNIKSRSVQINNGAVIEGFCSQSYSDIDVKSFFA